MPSYFDIHAHFDRYDDETRLGVLERMEESDTWAIAVGTRKATSKKAVKLAGERDDVFACAGVHPDEIKTADDVDDEFAELIADEHTVAVGECGFDYFRADREKVKDAQEKVFEAQIEQAIKNQKPLMLHLRPSEGEMDAYDDALEVLESHAQKAGEKLSGNAHFFAGTIDHIKRFLDIGFSVSFTGVVTFTADYNERVMAVPSDMLHAETDAPFVAPEPYRGKENEPSYVQYVARQLAEIRGEPEEAVQQLLVDNALRHFKITRD